MAHLNYTSTTPRTPKTSKLTLPFSIPEFSPTLTPMAPTLTSLGSSFAAGPSLPPQISTPAGLAASRSSSNYAHLLATRLGANLTDLSVSGATLLNILTDPQTRNGHTFPPQISELPEDSDIVLVLAGGNDIGFVGGLMYESVQSYLLGRVLLSALAYLGIQQPPDASAALSEEALVERFGAVLDALHAKVPRAKIVVVEYLTIIDETTRAGLDIPLTAQQLERHLGVAGTLARATVEVVGRRGEWCLRVPAGRRSQGHGVGSSEPWVTGFGLVDVFTGWRTPYHPNREGMERVWR